MAYLNLAMLYQAEGEFLQAQEALEKARRFAHKYHLADLHERAKGLQALYQLSGGRSKRWPVGQNPAAGIPSIPFGRVRFLMTNRFMHPADIESHWRSRPNIKRWARCLNGDWAMPNRKIGWA